MSGALCAAGEKNNSMPLRLLICPLLLAALLATGLDTIRQPLTNAGDWAAHIRPLAGSFALDFGILAALLALALRVGGDRLRRALPALMAAALLLSQAAFVVLAWPVLSAPMPWGVDHASFLYRLHEVRATFPALGGWSPWWNGGAEHYFGVTSGIHGYAFLVSPLLAFLEPHRFQGAALFFWFFLGFPWLAVASLRAIGARWTTALAGGMLLTACNRSTVLFGWQYGIVGGMTTVGLTLPLVALSYRLVALRRGGWGTAAAVGVLAWLSSIWTPGVFTCLGLCFSALVLHDAWTRRSFVRMAFAAALALVLLSPWFWITLGPSRAIVDFVAASVPRPPLPQMLRFGLTRFVHRLLEWHPAILAFGVGGTLVAAGGRRLRRWMLPVLLVLSAATLSIVWKRQSQFDRIAFQMSAAAAFPAAVMLGRLLVRRAPSRRDAPGAAAEARRWALAAAQGVALAALALGLRVAGVHAAGTGGFPVRVASPAVLDFADWIRDQVPEEGRVAFMGMMENHFGGGTTAYLPILTGREMMGDDYYTFPRGMTERDFPPRFYRSRSHEGVLDFSRAFGVTHWVVWHPRYVRFFEERPDLFEPVHEAQDRGPVMHVFRVHGVEPGRLLKGEGTVEARENRIVVRPADSAQETLVLRYRWRDNLRCRTPGASIEPYAFDEHIQLVAVRPNGAGEVVIGHWPSRHHLAPDDGGWLHH